MHGHLLQDLGLCIVAATVVAYLARWARQPLLLAYIAAGVVIGPLGFAFITEAESIHTLAELGLAFLLFIVGLEVDLRRLLELGKVATITAVVQVTGSALLGWGTARLLGYDGVPALYLAAAVAFSSTMIVIKLLTDRSELDTLSGRLTLGILLVQDLLAIVVLAIQPNLGGVGAGESTPVLAMSLSVVKGLGLAGGTLLVGRFVLPFVLKSVAKSPEILLVSAVSWCFLVCWAAMQLELSSAMGALIAGVSISTLPYSIEVVAKIRSLRDFFVTLFFVSLGMLLPVPSARLLVAALVVSGVVIASRFLTILPTLRLLRYDNRSGLMSAIHLSQISEFALVIMLIGASDHFRHITSEIVSLVVMVLVLTATLSTYLVQFSHPLVRALLRRTAGTPLEDPMSEATRHGERGRVPIVLVGCFRVGSSLVHDLLGSGRKFKVIDFNPRVHHELRKLGVPCVYGDISHVDTLEHAGVEGAEVLISSIPDDFLRGTTNRQLLETLRKLNPRATILVTAVSTPKALELYEAGADYVMMPRVLAADRFVEILGSVEHGDLAEIRGREIEALRTRKEVLL